MVVWYVVEFEFGVVVVDEYVYFGGVVFDVDGDFVICVLCCV